MGETEPKTCISIFNWDKKKAPENEGAIVPQRKGMRRSSSMGIFKAALGMLRTKSMSQLAVSDSKPDMSPMQSPTTSFPPSLSRPEKVALEIVPGPMPGEEQKVEATVPSLSSIAVPAVSESDMNQNNSPHEEIAKEKCGPRHDDDGGDEKIDTKAEEFIAQFYEQMKLQSMNS
ncbi:hypothetical protein V6N13_002959 [Hibiscus sabdariffa]|uniref:Uncharacterized protein n=2 Tax=Hibiscus sabdariffa TaxID=183260 RepID=A0ABR2AUL2_9ROSI